MKKDKQVQELTDLAQQEGVRLPYSPSFIADMEALGYVVDLLTGELIWNEADRPQPLRVTEAGNLALKGAI